MSNNLTREWDLIGPINVFEKKSEITAGLDDRDCMWQLNQEMFENE